MIPARYKITILCLLLIAWIVSCSQPDTPISLPTHTRTLPPAITQTAQLPRLASATATKSVSPSLSPTVTAENTATPTLIYSATAVPNTAIPPQPTQTRTIVPQVINQPSPTASPDFPLPGFFNTGGCQTIGSLNPIEFCINFIELQEDGYLRFYVSWNSHSPQDHFRTSRLGAFSPYRYLSDNLGNLYYQVRTEDDYGNEVPAGGENLVVVDSFLFPPPKPGAVKFTYHYDDGPRFTIENINFLIPIKFFEDFALTLYPTLVLSYKTAVWESSVSELGEETLTHKEITNCRIEEGLQEIQGKFKGNITLEAITYDIYGWLEDEWRVREYVATSGYPGEQTEIQPVIRVTIPYDESLACIYAASEVLSTLKAKKP